MFVNVLSIILHCLGLFILDVSITLHNDVFSTTVGFYQQSDGIAICTSSVLVFVLSSDENQIMRKQSAPPTSVIHIISACSYPVLFLNKGRSSIIWLAKFSLILLVTDQSSNQLPNNVLQGRFHHIGYFVPLHAICILTLAFLPRSSLWLMRRVIAMVSF